MAKKTITIEILGDTVYQCTVTGIDGAPENNPRDWMAIVNTMYRFASGIASRVYEGTKATKVAEKPSTAKRRRGRPRKEA